MLTGNARLAVWLFWVLFLPGTVLHELSHWVTATLLRVKTGRFSFWPQLKKKGELQMGSLEVDEADPFRYSLIGLAPLIFGSVTVLVIGQGWLELGQLGQAIGRGSPDALSEALSRTLSVPDVWLWLYLLFAISNAMLPSESDRRAWRTVLTYLGLALALVIGLGFNPTVSPAWQEFILTIVRYLLTAFLMTVAVDLFFILLIILVENTLAVILGRRVQYNR
ncbi:MAG: hypothetical protein AB1801_08080 [Chloroflexota bacterium]